MRLNFEVSVSVYLRPILKVNTAWNLVACTESKGYVTGDTYECTMRLRKDLLTKNIASSGELS